MRNANRHAFKEWAAVCRAVAAGRQTVLFRKGGIHERRGTFEVDQEAFWLFPTRFHQAEAELTEDGRPFLEAANRTKPDAGTVQITEYVAISDVRFIEDPGRLAALRPFHLYDDQVLQQRFEYRRPGLFVIVVRAFVLDVPMRIAESAHFGGCRSWVELPSELSTSGLRPVLDDAAFQAVRRELLAALEPDATC